MKQSRFVFNINACVGCMACVAGCSIENDTLHSGNWRSVSTNNSIRHPNLPVFHLSLACNHCEDAPCMHNCPALAYTRDPETGHIIHHPEACMGCKYCTWACPYDAPKFNPILGIVEKCTFCTERLDNNRLPACVDACPVGALGYEQTDTISKTDQGIPGFRDAGIQPSIRFVPLRAANTVPKTLNLDQENIPMTSAREWLPKPLSKVLPTKEWVLILFTVTIPWLAGWFGSMVSHSVSLLLPIFSGIGLSLLALSMLHLGKKSRAWRAMLNLKNSWLSREIVSTGLFVLIGTLYYFFPTPLVGYSALFLALISLVSIDMVYTVFLRPSKLLLHSSMAILTGFLFYGLFAQIIFLIGFSLTFKAGLYVYRKMLLQEKEPFWKIVRSIIRLSTLLLTLIYLGFGWYAFLPWWLIMGLVFIGELIDRTEFYEEAEIPHPQSELNELFLNNPYEKQS